MTENSDRSSRIREIFNRDDLNMKVIISLLLLGSIVSIFLAIGIGPVSVHPISVVKIIISKLPFLTDNIVNNWTRLDENIVWGLRLPRVLLGMIVGASLAVTGVAMQALVRNHLADPFILGVSSGASATATLGMLFGVFSFLGTYALSISAFIGAAMTIIMVYTISRVKGRINITHVITLGCCHCNDYGCCYKYYHFKCSKCIGLA